MSAFMGGLQSGAQLLALQDARAERERLAQEAAAKQAAAEAMQAEMAALAEAPTSQGVLRLMIKYPSLAENYKRAYDVLSPEEQRASINAAMPIYAALENGDNATAQKLLSNQAEAYKNAGMDKAAAGLQALAKTVEIDPGAAKISLGGFLATAQGPDKFSENFIKIRGASDELRRKGAEATKEEAEAQIKQREAKGIPAPKFVETTQGVMAWNSEKGKLEPTGYMPYSQPQVQVSLGEGQKGFENATTLRKEYNAESKPFSEAIASYSRMQSAAQAAEKDPTGASDIAMIYSYMKMLDPGSVVREGEFATAENAGGVGAKVRNLYNKIVEGKRLTAEVRKEYLTVAGKIFTESNVKYNKLKKRYKGIAERAGLDPENVITPEESGASGRIVEVDF
jgi:hypothetical protein